MIVVLLDLLRVAAELVELCDDVVGEGLGAVLEVRLEVDGVF